MHSLLKAVVFVACLGPAVAWGGLFEVSATGSYRKTNFDANRSTTMESITGGLAYYFWEMSALQFSYTRGAGNQVQPEYTAYQTFEAYGADLLFTIADRSSIFKPYIKGGAAYMVKNLRTYVPVPGTNPIIYQQASPIQVYGVVPTAGIGFKLMVGQQFAIKTGVDVSQSPMTNSSDNTTTTTYDFALNAGISFIF